MKRKTIFCAGAAATTMLGAHLNASQPYVIDREIIPPNPGDSYQSPSQVSGKEYTDSVDINQNQLSDPSRTLYWDGLGGVLNAPKFGTPDWQIDALANHQDILYFDSVQNRAPIVVSVTGDSPTASIWYETPSSVRNTWATKMQINAAGVTDLDALELWGPELEPDSEVISFHGDPGGIALWSNFGIPLVSDAAIASALSPLLGTTVLPGQVDVDALMAQGMLDTSTFTGEILFSLEPIDGILDGGEVFRWTVGSSTPAVYLNHGGHLWDTAFDVRTAFGVENENIDALEAVGTPEPSTLIGGVAVALLALNRIRKRQDSPLLIANRPS